MAARHRSGCQTSKETLRKPNCQNRQSRTDQPGAVEGGDPTLDNGKRDGRRRRKHLAIYEHQKERKELPILVNRARSLDIFLAQNLSYLFTVKSLFDCVLIHYYLLTILSSLRYVNRFSHLRQFYSRQEIISRRLKFFIYFIALVRRRAYGPPDAEWLPLPMDFRNMRDRAKPLPTIK